MSFIDDKPVVGDCVYCEVPVVLGEPAVSVNGGVAHKECPDARQCENCDNLCLDAPADGVCCRCKWEFEAPYRIALGQDRYVCSLCEKEDQK